jgi:hypothetical protein
MHENQGKRAFIDRFDPAALQLNGIASRCSSTFGS